MILFKTVGIIGNGFVGNAIAKGFGKFVNCVKIYDIDETKSKHSFEDVNNCDYVFVCLPTPMTVKEGGKCNLNIIKDYFSKLKPNQKSIYIIKSTVPIGTTNEIQEKYPNLLLVHNPEFLTALNAESDFVNNDRTVIGGKSKHAVLDVAELYQQCFPNTPIHKMTSDESEAVKYIANCFLATKVIFFNEIKKLSDAFNLNYDIMLEAVIADERIGNSHWQVPGFDGDYGFGGTCFPKDVNALIRMMELKGINAEVLKAVWNQNKKYRTHWDWSENKSAVMLEECNVR